MFLSAVVFISKKKLRKNLGLAKKFQRKEKLIFEKRVSSISRKMNRNITAVVAQLHYS